MAPTTLLPRQLNFNTSTDCPIWPQSPLQLARWPLPSNSKTRNIPLDSLKLDPEFQPRAGLRQEAVNRYARQMEQGTIFPPIEVAAINGELYVIDGFHRHAAALKAGKRKIACNEQRMTKDQAFLKAVQINSEHGLTYGNKDKKHMWRLYADKGLHLLPSGRTKPLRVIAEELGGVISYGSVRNYLRADGLEVLNDDGDEVEPWSYNGPDAYEMEEEEGLEEAYEAVRVKLMEFSSAAHALQGEVARRQLLADLEQAFRDLKVSYGVASDPPSPHFLDI